MKIIKYTSLIVVVLIIGIYLHEILNVSGLFLKIPISTKSNCKKIEPIVGPEDFALVDNLLFISSSRLPPRFNYGRGDIFLVDLDKTEKKPISLAQKFNISPHGIFAKKINEGMQLWVVNHSENRDSIEVFIYRNGTLLHEKSIESEEFSNLNDIVLLNDNSFYVTHDHGSRINTIKTFEDYTLFGLSYVSHVKGNKVRRVTGNLSFANGIEKLGNKVYVAEMLGKSLLEYEILENYDLKLLREIELPFSPDNITKYKSDLIIGTYPKLFDMQKHSRNPNKISSSSVISVDIKNSHITRLFDEDGKRISGISVASIYKDKIYLGSVYGSYILECELN